MTATDPLPLNPSTPPAMWGLPSTARVVDVGLRDGLQAISKPLATERKLEIVDELIAAGVREIEVASFAHPKVLPQLADAADVLARVPRGNGVTYRALVPNVRGAERAAQCAIDQLGYVLPAEDGMAEKNQGKTVAELAAGLPRIREVSAGAGQRLVVGVACAFFSPCHGPVSRDALTRVLDAIAEAGADGAYLATTTGQETPREVYEGLSWAIARYPSLEFGVHLHNRNGAAPACALAALSAGAQWLETSFAGLGGDMWFPGDPSVLGNMATEDLVQLLDGMGIASGISLDAIRRLGEAVLDETGFPPSAFVTRGGTRRELAEARWK